MNRTCGVLENIRVIDFGHHLAGPLVGMLLADQGAEVTKVERPAGQEPSDVVNAVYNRGKRYLCLDLKDPAGRRAANALIESADVLIENFRPGVMERLGFGADAMAQLNPRLVYLSLPGFASEDEPSRSIPAWEGVISAASGVYTDLNVLREFLHLPPVYSALPYGSVYGAVHGALAVIMALTGRMQSGRGEIIEVPLASAAISAMGSNVLHIPSQPRRYDMPPISRVTRRFLLPAIRRIIAWLGSPGQEAAYRAARSRIPAFMRSYACADGRLLHLFAIEHRRHSQDLLRALGVLEAVENEGLRATDPYANGGGRNNLSEGTDLSNSFERKLKGRIAARLATESAETWEAELGALGVPCAVQRTTAEWLSLPALSSVGIVLDGRDRTHGRLHQPGLSCWITGDAAPAVNLQPAKPLTREEREIVLTGKKANRKCAVAPDRQPAAPEILNGIRVLDLSTMIAGPVCARTLAEYGAEIIKVGSPDPLHGPRMTCLFGVDVDQGKRSLLVDLKTQEGTRILHALIERADVLVHNFSVGAARRLGLAQDELKRLNPQLVLCRVGAYEGPMGSAWTGRKAYDPVLQAASGIMVRYGSAAEPEYHGLASCIDYLTGYCAAMAAALALFRRTNDPESGGCEAVTSLAQGAQLIQMPLAFDPSGRACDQPSGQLSRGDHLFHRLYRARDRWFFLGAHNKESKDLASEDIFGPFPSSILTCEQELARFLEARFRAKPVSHWQEVLRPFDVAVMPIYRLSEVRNKAVRAKPHRRHLTGGPSIQVIRQAHAVGSDVDTVAPAYARLRQHPLRYLDPAPKPGSNTLEILEELGAGPDERQRLLDAGVVAGSLSEDYLPS